MSLYESLKKKSNTDDKNKKSKPKSKSKLKPEATKSNDGKGKVSLREVMQIEKESVHINQRLGTVKEILIQFIINSFTFAIISMNL